MIAKFTYSNVLTPAQSALVGKIQAAARTPGEHPTSAYDATVEAEFRRAGGWLVIKVGSQWWVYYSSGKMWASYGETREAALRGALADAWAYA